MIMVTGNVCGLGGAIYLGNRGGGAMPNMLCVACSSFYLY